MTKVPEQDSPSADSSWANDGFPDVQPEPLPPDNTELINPPEKACAACGEEITREPGQKGRLPKYHPECKPARGSVTSSGPRPVRVTAKDRAVAEQVEELLAMADAKISKAVMLIALADPYDAFVIHANKPELLENLRPILFRFAWLRENATNVGAGASLLGFGLTVLTTLLPIAAHHNLIPSKTVAKLLLGIPFVLKKMQESMADNGESMTETLMARMREQQAKANEARARAQAQSESVDASFAG
jgi:hypothetical protein